MSKYIKLEDAINVIEDKIAEYIPTLYGRYAEIPLELRMAIEHLPTIEVSEDCISREWVRENMLKYGFLAPDMTVTEFIEDAPSVIPQVPSEDCISREWLEQEIEREVLSDIEPDIHYGWNWALNKVAEIIRNAPSVVPTTEQSSMVGKWIADRYCSECEWDKSNADYTSGWTENYCPNCGAKMKGN